METSNNLYHDLNSLNLLRLKSKTSQRETLRAAVKEFEAYFLNLMLKNMRQTNRLFSEDNPLSSDDVEFYNDMHDQQLALELSRSSKFGIGDLLFAQLSQHLPKDGGEKETPAIKLEQTQQSSQLTVDRVMNEASASKKRANTNESLDELSPTSVSDTKDFVASPQAYHANKMQAEAISKLEEQSLASDLSRWVNALTEQVSAIRAGADLSNQNGEADFSQQDKHLTKRGANSPELSLVNKEYSFASKQKFIDTLKPYAQKASKLLGVHPGLLIAQAALETGWGKHLPKTGEGKPSLNLFGIKADSRWSGETVRTTTLEFIEGIPEKLTQAFRAYQSIEESFEDYVNFIQSNPRYQSALEKAADPEQYLEEIQKSGYATDPDYARKIHSIFLREQLFQLSD